MKKVYIAGPYSYNEAVNIHNAVIAANALLARGYLPFIPHLCHLWHLITPKHYSSWLTYGLEWLKECDCVFRLPGDSPGADAEVAEAERLGLPVYHSYHELA
jgi:hypothetical protein